MQPPVTQEEGRSGSGDNIYTYAAVMVSGGMNTTWDKVRLANSSSGYVALLSVDDFVEKGQLESNSREKSPGRNADPSPDRA